MQENTLNDFVKRLKNLDRKQENLVVTGREQRTSTNIDAVDEMVFNLKQSDFGHASVRKDIISNICCKLNAFISITVCC